MAADDTLPAKLDALSQTVRLVREDTRTIRGMLTGHADTLAGQRAMLAGQGETLAQHGELLREILRRLSAEPGAGSRGEDRAG